MVESIMPELPEVETVKNTLRHDIIGKTIISIDVYYNRIIQNVSEKEFKEFLIGQTFLDIDRIGKYLIFVLNDYYMIAHLRMEGKYFLMHDEELTKHDHIVFNFSDSNLRYNDTRKFGVIYLYKKSEYNSIDSLRNTIALKNVGIEPFYATKEYLYDKLKNNRSPIKTSLLDQSIMCGLGNIYVDEVLFMTKLHPMQLSNTITIEECDEIIKNSIIVLNKAIALGGTTIRSFMSSHEITGRFQNELLIHTKETCPICGKKVSKIRVGGRGTYYCENCQTLK